MSMAIILFVLHLFVVYFKISTASTSNVACIDGLPISLNFGLYLDICPDAEPIVFSWVENAISQDPRMAASLLRLHFHDCFVNGCDASVLLDDTPNMIGEKTAAPNLNSLRGFDVIDAIKTDLESICPQTVSCADILAIAARDSVVLSGGPGWEVPMGRKDSLTANKTAANNNIPAPNSNVAMLVSNFQNVGLTLADMVTLSGAHTLGKARCATFNARFNGNSAGSAPDVNLEFINSLQILCTQSMNSNTTLADLDLVTPSTFDNQYYVNLLSGEGLLPSDQVLTTGNDQTRELVQSYVDNSEAFFQDFPKAMVRMGNLLPKNGENGEIRTNCHVSN